MTVERITITIDSEVLREFEETKPFEEDRRDIRFKGRSAYIEHALILYIKEIRAVRVVESEYRNDRLQDPGSEPL